MSICINRREGTISHQMMCGAPGRIGKCPWYRALVCIPLDLVGAAWFVVWRSIRKMFFTV